MDNEIRIHPSILNADHSNILSEIDRVSKVSDLLHLDILDGKFAPNTSFSWQEAQYIISGSSIPVDAHLMVADVDEIAVQYAEIGCASVTIHAEATKNIPQTLRNIRKAGSRSSLGIKPNTDISDYHSVIDDVDMFLIMTVEPGFGGQSFMENMMDKVRRTREMIGDRPIWLQVDGGISMKTIEMALDAGADTFVVGSAVFNAPDPAAMVVSLREYATAHGNK